jgi:Fe2+ transport system protein FeoA
MNTISFSCPLCGHSFDPSASPGCASCPLHSGCRIICCPSCGHSTVDPGASRMARWAAAALGRLGRAADRVATQPGPHPLSATAAPCRVRVVELLRDNGDRGGRLRAYGLAPGTIIEVIQQRPVTVICVEHTELAIEAEIAACLLVEPVKAGMA